MAQLNELLVLGKAQFNSQVDILNALYVKTINPFSIEFQGDSSHGGYIDFHYGKSTSDYTSRIIESASGKFTFYAPNGIISTGNVAIERNGLSSFWCRSSASNTNALIGVERTDVNQKMALLIGSGGTQRGLWDYNINNSGENGWFCFTDGTDCWFATNAKYNNVYLGSTNVYVNNAGVLYGAAWNDYAEYRKAEIIEPGRVVVEDLNGVMKQSNERLQPGAEIISDTYGFAIGETEECQTPIAVCGRVLAYPAEDRYSYPLGAAVCSGPNGTVSLMTREEIKEYPERIIGTVSEIPEYDEWGTEQKIKVNNRIWIRIK